MTGRKKPLRDADAGRTKPAGRDKALRKAREELKDSRDRFRELYDLAPVGYADLDARGLILSINATGAALLGHSRFRLKGFPFTAFVAPNDIQSFLNHLRRCLNAREPISTPITLSTRGGLGTKPLRAQMTSVAVRPESGAVVMRTAFAASSRPEEEENARRAAQLSEFSTVALSRLDLPNVAAAAAGFAARTLGAVFVEVLELLPGGSRLRTVAAAGRRNMTAKSASADTSPYSRVLRTREPVPISSEPADFVSRASHLTENGLIGGVAVLVPADPDRPYGVLGIYTTVRRVYSAWEIHFLQSVANILGAAAATRRMEESLRKSEERYRGLFREMIAGSALHEIICDPSGTPVDYRFLDVNPAFEAIMELRADQVLGRTVREVLPGIEPFGIETYGRVALTGKPEHFQQFFAPLKKHFEVLAYSPRHGRFAATFLDVTDRIRAEEALRETTRTLRELIHASPAGILVLDLQGKVLLWNPAMEQILGWTEEEVRGKLVPTVAEGQEGAREVLTRHQAGETLNGFEARRTRKDGRPVDIQIWTTLLRDDNGDLKSILEIVLDVTRIKAMEEAALRQEKMAALGQVAAGIAHEIRNPLSGLNIYLANLELALADSGNPDAEKFSTMRAAIDLLKKASGRIDAVVNRVMDFSRARPPRLVPSDLNRCIEEAVALSTMALRRTGVEVRKRLEEKMPPLPVDPRLIEQVILNLVTNAAQAFAGRAGPKDIEVASVLENAHAVITVSDSGPGVPDHLREKIFDPFFTTRQEGTGLGLAFSRKVITDHGGTLTVDRSPLGGAAFRITLPLGRRRAALKPTG